MTEKTSAHIETLALGFTGERQGPRRQSRCESTSPGRSFLVVLLGVSWTGRLALVSPCSLVAGCERIPHGLHLGVHRVYADFELCFTHHVALFREPHMTLQSFDGSHISGIDSVATMRLPLPWRKWQTRSPLSPRRTVRAFAPRDTLPFNREDMLRQAESCLSSQARP